MHCEWKTNDSKSAPLYSRGDFGHDDDDDGELKKGQLRQKQLTYNAISAAPIFYQFGLNISDRFFVSSFHLVKKNATAKATWTFSSLF